MLVTSTSRQIWQIFHSLNFIIPGLSCGHPLSTRLSTTHDWIQITCFEWALTTVKKVYRIWRNCLLKALKFNPRPESLPTLTFPGTGGPADLCERSEDISCTEWRQAMPAGCERQSTCDLSPRAPSLRVGRESRSSLLLGHAQSACGYGSLNPRAKTRRDYKLHPVMNMGRRRYIGYERVNVSQLLARYDTLRFINKLAGFMRGGGALVKVVLPVIRRLGVWVTVWSMQLRIWTHVANKVKWWWADTSKGCWPTSYKDSRLTVGII